MRDESHSTLTNPILGKWEIGPFKTVCTNSHDTTYYQNTNGDIIEFKNNDTAYYTYYSTGATGKGSFKILTNSTFLLSYVQEIISFDGKYLITHWATTNNASQEWATYIKR
ncbi:MAG: hypothetical protein IPP81_14595 [Chitinophagaceae bacterium]|nr:hypothetical protein [Chitinophagaceae bacterium]